MKQGNKKLWQGVEACLLIKQGRIKCINIKGQTLEKSLYISSTVTNITIPSIKSILQKPPLIIFALLWNLWFSKIFCHTCCSNVFFTFNMSFLKKSKHGTFRFFFLFLGFERPTCFTSKNKELSLSLQFLPQERLWFSSSILTGSF